MSLKLISASSGLLVAGALLSVLAPSSAKAVLNCTFGSTAGCTSSPESNLQFSNFSFSGAGVESADAIQISKTGPGESYTIALNAAGGGQFDADANITYKLTPLNGYKLKLYGASSTVNVLDSPLFSFVYNGSNLPSTLTTTGNTVGPVNFSSPLTSSDIVLTWNNGASTASGTSFFVSLEAPSTVPGPLPLLGAASAFGFARKLRKRTQASA